MRRSAEVAAAVAVCSGRAAPAWVVSGVPSPPPCQTAAMDDRRVAAAAGLTRVAIGGGMLAAPRASSRPWLGGDAGRGATQAVVRMVGARDLLLGLGLWRAANGGRSTKSWLAYTAAADAADATAVLLAWRDLPRWRRLLVLLVAGGSAVAGAALSVRAD